jgi:hypothetical protein
MPPNMRCFHWYVWVAVWVEVPTAVSVKVVVVVAVWTKFPVIVALVNGLTRFVGELTASVLVIAALVGIAE